MQIYYESGAFEMAAYLHEDGQWEIFSEDNPRDIGADEMFFVRIGVHGHQLNVSFMGSKIQFPFTDDRIPPWAANWLTVAAYTVQYSVIVRFSGAKCKKCDAFDKMWRWNFTL
jgi:hypothetical protein